MSAEVPIRETDEAFRARIAAKYGMWGAYLSHVMECSGAALDEAGEYVELKRLGAATNAEAR